MKYKDRKEQRRVTETMVALLVPMLDYLKEETAERVRIALRILDETEIEGEDV